MRDRLIELIKQVPYGATVGAKFTQQFSEKMADNLLVNGVIVLPCKVGTRVYRIVPDISVTWPDPTEYKTIWDNFKLTDIYNFGKTVFLTREEAEKALIERIAEDDSTKA